MISRCDSSIVSAEKALLDKLCDLGNKQTSPIFIMGSPRTGSTVLYQSVCSVFGLPFISNFTNDYFFYAPIIGMALQNAVDVDINFDSAFGKTSGEFQPSEASAVMGYWFGGKHPSAIASSTIQDASKEVNLVTTLTAVERLFNAPLVIKNAWNCYRIRYLAQTLPHARFIWICRDIADAAKSDLLARYRTKGSANEWNSATPSNWDELKKLDPVKQVVENQYQMNFAIGRDLTEIGKSRWLKVWYEDLIVDPYAELEKISSFLRAQMLDGVSVNLKRPSGSWGLDKTEIQSLDTYVQLNYKRFKNLIYKPNR